MREQDDQTVGRQHWGLQELFAEEDGYDGSGLMSWFLPLHGVGGDSVDAMRCWSLGTGPIARQVACTGP